MINKFKNKNGSAMTLAIVVLLIIGICGSTMSGMAINQIKSTKSNSDSIDLKYQTEAEVETLVAEYIDQIKVEGERSVKVDHRVLIWYFMIAHRYVEIAEAFGKDYNTDYSDSVKDSLNAENNPYPGVKILSGDHGHIGNLETEIERYVSDSCLCFSSDDCESCTHCKHGHKGKPNGNDEHVCNSEKIKELKENDLIYIKDKFEKIYSLLEQTIEDNSENNISKNTRAMIELKNIMHVCKNYLDLILNHIEVSSDGSLEFSYFTVEQCKNFIRGVLNNISKTEYAYFADDNKNYGTVGVLYRNVYIIRGLNSSHICNNGRFCDICKLNDDIVVDPQISKYGTLTKNIESYLQNPEPEQEELTSIINSIESHVKNLTSFKINSSSNSSGFEALEEFYSKSLNESITYKHGNGNGNGNESDIPGNENHGQNSDNIVNQLKTAVQYELGFLKYFLQNLDKLEYGNDDITSSFKIEVPSKLDGEKVKLDEGFLRDECNRLGITLNDSNPDKYILTFEKATSTDHRVLLDINVNAIKENYNINSTVRIIISSVIDENTYKINYQVQDWNSKNNTSGEVQ